MQHTLEQLLSFTQGWGQGVVKVCTSTGARCSCSSRERERWRYVPAQVLSAVAALGTKQWWRFVTAQVLGAVAAPELGPVLGTSTWDQYLGPVPGTSTWDQAVVKVSNSTGARCSCSSRDREWCSYSSRDREWCSCSSRDREWCSCSSRVGTRGLGKLEEYTFCEEPRRQNIIFLK